MSPEDLKRPPFTGKSAAPRGFWMPQGKHCLWEWPPGREHSRAVDIRGVDAAPTGFRKPRDRYCLWERPLYCKAKPLTRKPAVMDFVPASFAMVPVASAFETAGVRRS